jgi:hypothetical protein
LLSGKFFDNNTGTISSRSLSSGAIQTKSPPQAQGDKMPPLATRKERAPAKDPLVIALEELDAPFKSTLEAKRKKLILTLALLFILDLIFFRAYRTERSPTPKPLAPEHNANQPSRQDSSNQVGIKPLDSLPIVDRTLMNNQERPDSPPPISRTNQVYFTHLALDRAQLAARQDKLALENIYFQSLKSNLTDSQMKDLKEMRNFRQQDLQLQEERINKLKAEL